MFAPRLDRFTAGYRRIRLDLLIGDALADVVALGCDAGVRLQTKVAEDMVAIPLTATQRTTIVGAPSYTERLPAPHRGSSRNLRPER